MFNLVFCLNKQTKNFIWILKTVLKWTEKLAFKLFVVLNLICEPRNANTQRENTFTSFRAITKTDIFYWWNLWQFKNKSRFVHTSEIHLQLRAAFHHSFFIYRIPRACVNKFAVKYFRVHWNKIRFSNTSGCFSNILWILSPSSFPSFCNSSSFRWQMTGLCALSHASR